MSRLIAAVFADRGNDPVIRNDPSERERRIADLAACLDPEAFARAGERVFQKRRRAARREAANRIGPLSGAKPVRTHDPVPSPASAGGQAVR